MMTSCRSEPDEELQHGQEELEAMRGEACSL